MAEADEQLMSLTVTLIKEAVSIEIAVQRDEMVGSSTARELRVVIGSIAEVRLGGIPIELGSTWEQAQVESGGILMVQEAEDWAGLEKEQLRKARLRPSSA